MAFMEYGLDVMIVLFELQHGQSARLENYHDLARHLQKKSSAQDLIPRAAADHRQNLIHQT